MKKLLTLILIVLSTACFGQRYTFDTIVNVDRETKKRDTVIASGSLELSGFEDVGILIISHKNKINSYLAGPLLKYNTTTGIYLFKAVRRDTFDPINISLLFELSGVLSSLGVTDEKTTTVFFLHEPEY